MNSNSLLSCDVFVCGGGVAGTMAAVAAARHGAHVILAERYGFLGGNATAGAVGQFNSWQTANGRKVVAGLADEVVQRLRRYGAAAEHQVFVMSTGHKMDRVEYAPEVLKLVLDDMVSEAGVQPLLHAQLLGVDCGGRQVSAVHMLTKSGVLKISPRMLIDASGDLDALRHAGCKFLELAEGEALQPATMMFRFGPVDFDRFDNASKEEIKSLAQRGYQTGALARAALHASRNPYSNDAWFNISRLSVDATDAMALGKAEIEGRKQAWLAAEFLQAHVPGCEKGRLQAFATQVGIRETRRVEGEHILTSQELMGPTLFKDAIAAGAYPIDIHPTQGGGLTYKAMDDNHAYQIPYRSLIPRKLDNAYVVGRGISADHEALAAIRVMTISMAVGQAAGTAAAMMCKILGPVSTRALNVQELQQRLLEDGGLLGEIT
jgi:hypothetical protein